MSNLKKIKYILPIVGLAFAGSVMAYAGSHSFTGLNVSSSNGHNYKAQYSSNGTFPFNGAGLFDKTRVNLKGTVIVSEVDGKVVSESYCLSLNGSLKSSGGTIKTVQYTDTSCTNVAERKTYLVGSYLEDGIGTFSAVATDSAGITYTLQGTHTFGQ